MGTSSEIGKELTPSQLVTKTVVVLVAIHRPEAAMTAWVMDVDEKFAVFHQGATNMTLILRISGDKFFDDVNHRIYVHEYLGEI
jgi:hypothetical protein